MLVRPVRVVDEQGERPLLGQPRAQPVQPVEAREQAIVRGRAIGHVLEQRARQSGGARERPLTLAVGERLDGRRQQLDHDAERELALQHAAARAQHVHPLRLGELRGRAPAASSCRSRPLPRSARSRPSRPRRCGARRRSAPARPRAPAGGFACSDPSGAGSAKPTAPSESLRWVHVAKRARPAIAWLTVPAGETRAREEPAMFNAQSALLVARAVSGEPRACGVPPSPRHRRGARRRASVSRRRIAGRVPRFHPMGTTPPPSRAEMIASRS